MILKNNFFERRGPFALKDLFNKNNEKKNIKIEDVKILIKAKKSDITFLTQ